MTILAHYWKFDEGTGTTVADETGSATVTLNDSGLWSSNVPTVLFSDPFSLFGGGGGQGTFSGFATGTDWTIAFWHNLGVQGAGYGTVFSNTAGTSGIYANGNNNKISFLQGGTYTDNATALTLFDWTHIALVCSGGNITFYKDGVADGTVSGTSSWTASRIAADDTFKFLVGPLDDLRFYDYALTSGNIASLAAGNDFRPSSTSIKTRNGVAIANVKAIDGVAIANVKTQNGVA